MSSQQARKQLKSRAAWKGYEFYDGKKRRRIQYIDNTAKIGKDLVCNQDRRIDRDCQVVLGDEFTKRRSNQRNLSIEEAVKAVAFGIETRSDRNNKKRYQYLYNDILAAGRWLDEGLFELLTAYRITKANRRNFLNDFEFLKSELLSAGTYNVDAMIADTSMIMACKLQGESADDAIVWRLGEPPFRTDGTRVYSLTLVLTCKDKISLSELNVLKNWGLHIGDALQTKQYKDGIRYMISYNMSRFCGNEHEWSYC